MLRRKRVDQSQCWNVGKSTTEIYKRRKKKKKKKETQLYRVNLDHPEKRHLTFHEIIT